MGFEKIIGQKRVILILERALKSKRMPHALLFHGPKGVGKEAVALELAKALFCQKDEVYCNKCSDCKRVGKLLHPDLMLIYPAPKQPKDEELKSIRESLIKNPYHRAQPWANPSILIDMIRNLKKTVSMTSYENKGRVVLIMDAHRMTNEAANSLLKILEEPLGKLTLILISSQANLLLPTIISRCQKIRFDPLPWQEIEDALIKREQISQEQAKIFARMSFGSYRRALELLDEDVEQRQNLMIDMLRKMLMPDLDILLMVESLVNQQDKKAIKELIALMLIWFRDAMVMELLQDESDYKEKIINIDRQDILKNFISGLERIDYDQVIPKIEQALELIDRNVYINLVLLQLLFELKRFLRRKNHV